MKLVEMKCKNCAASISIDYGTRVGRCSYCGSEFVLDDEKVVVKHIMAGQITEEQEYINAKTNLDTLKDYKASYDGYSSLAKRFVNNSEVWIGLLRSFTKDFTYKINDSWFEEEYKKYWRNFTALTTSENVSKYSSQYDNYVNNVGSFESTFNYNYSPIDLPEPTIKYNYIHLDPLYIFLLLFLGIFGVHKFLEGHFKMGILYFCTLGLFGIGWLYDIIIVIKDAIVLKKANDEFKV